MRDTGRSILYLVAALSFLAAAVIFLFLEDNTPLGSPFAVLFALNLGFFLRRRRKDRTGDRADGSGPAGVPPE